MTTFLREGVVAQNANLRAHPAFKFLRTSLLVLFCFIVALRREHIDERSTIGILRFEWASLHDEKEMTVTNSEKGTVTYVLTKVHLVLLSLLRRCLAALHGTLLHALHKTSKGVSSITPNIGLREVDGISFLLTVRFSIRRQALVVGCIRRLLIIRHEDRGRLAKSIIDASVEAERLRAERRRGRLGTHLNESTRVMSSALENLLACLCERTLSSCHD